MQFRYAPLIIILLVFNMVSAQTQYPVDISLGAWNQQGTHIALASNSTVWIYDDELMLNHQFDISLEDTSGVVQINLLRWSPNGHFLAIGASFEGFSEGIFTFYDYIVIWETSPWQNVLTVEGVRDASQFDWSPGSNEFAIVRGTYTPNLQIYDIATGVIDRSLAVDDCAISHFNWHPQDISQMVIACSMNLYLFNPVTFEEEDKVAEFSSDYSPKYNINGLHLAYINDNMQLQIIDTTDYSESWLIPTSAQVLAFSWHIVPSEILILEADGTQRIWDVETEESVSMPSENGLRLWKPDGSAYLIIDRNHVILFDGLTDTILSELTLE